MSFFKAQITIIIEFITELKYYDRVDWGVVFTGWRVC